MKKLALLILLLTSTYLFGADVSEMRVGVPIYFRTNPTGTATTVMTLKANGSIIKNTTSEYTTSIATTVNATWDGTKYYSLTNTTSDQTINLPIPTGSNEDITIENATSGKIVTVNATSVGTSFSIEQCPGNSNCYLNDGDKMVLKSNGSTQWKIMNYFTKYDRFKNKIINGNFDLWQRGTNFDPIANATTVYGADRFYAFEDTDGILRYPRSTDVPLINIPSSMMINVNSTDTSMGAAQRAEIGQRIEGTNIAEMIGKVVTLSFYIKASKTGTYCVTLINGPANKVLVKEYVINSASTWERKSISFLVDGSMSWTIDSNGGGRLIWALAAGSNYITTADTWQSGYKTATSNQVNFMDNTGNYLWLTNVQLNIGAIPAPLSLAGGSIAGELAMAQRYFQMYGLDISNDSYIFGSGYAVGSTLAQVWLPFLVKMRSVPTTVTISAYSKFGLDCAGTLETISTSLGVNRKSYEGIQLNVTVSSTITAGDGCVLQKVSPWDATISLDAEL